jgi:hypothetical protein
MIFLWGEDMFITVLMVLSMIASCIYAITLFQSLRGGDTGLVQTLIIIVVGAFWILVIVAITYGILCVLPFGPAMG